MKKLVSIILAVMLVLSMSVSAYAAGSKKYEYGIYDRKAHWWYDRGDSNGTYFFDDKEQKDLLYGFAETMSRAEGMAALYRFVDKLQLNGMSLKSYEVVVEKTANHVYYIEAMNQYGDVWGCYFATFTHDSAETVMADMLAGRRIEYYSIFLTTYVNGQKIKDYEELERITGFDVLTDDAIDEFIYKLMNYSYYYDIYYGDYYDPEWYDGVG